MSKQFLAMEILMLASDSKLALKEDLHKYVPELPQYQWKITLQDLLHHTSGLRDRRAGPDTLGHLADTRFVAEIVGC